MSRESRLVVILAVIAAIGVSGLMLVANQYRKALPNTVAGRADGENPSVHAVRLVNGYLAARKAAKAVVDRAPGKIKQLTAVVTGDFSEVQGQRMSANADTTSAYRIERFNAFTAQGMTYEDYALVRAAWPGHTRKTNNPILKASTVRYARNAWAGGCIGPTTSRV